MSARFRPGSWADHVRLARHNVQQMNDATDEGARELAASPSFSRQLELASAVLALNEAVIVASGIVAWGMAMNALMGRVSCEVAKDPTMRLLLSVRRRMMHRGQWPHDAQGWMFTAKAWAMDHGVFSFEREPDLPFVIMYENEVWAEVTGARPAPG